MEEDSEEPSDYSDEPESILDVLAEHYGDDYPVPPLESLFPHTSVNEDAPSFTEEDLRLQEEYRASGAEWDDMVYDAHIEHLLDAEWENDLPPRDMVESWNEEGMAPYLDILGESYEDKQQRLEDSYASDIIRQYREELAKASARVPKYQPTYEILLLYNNAVTGLEVLRMPRNLEGYLHLKKDYMEQDRPTLEWREPKKNHTVLVIVEKGTDPAVISTAPFYLRRFPYPDGHPKYSS